MPEDQRRGTEITFVPSGKILMKTEFDFTTIEHRIRVATLIAPRQANSYTFDIHLQGEKETVFFDS